MIGGTYVKLSAFQTFSYGLYVEHVLDFKISWNPSLFLDGKPKPTQNT